MRLSWRGACAIGLAWALSACGSDDHGEFRLLTAAQWNQNPGTVDETGYWISVDFGWPDRAKSCFELPSGLHVTVNGREGTRQHDTEGDCLWDTVFDVGPFLPDEPQPTIVRVLDGKRLLGEATYKGLFPGTPARLDNPADGKVHIGDTLGLSLLAPIYGGEEHSVSMFFDAEYYWLDSPPGVPPYTDYTKIDIAPDQRTVSITTPTRSGRAAVVIDGLHNKEMTAAESCTGFTLCLGSPSAAVGPVFVEVVP
jgi:hypothetical protein